MDKACPKWLMGYIVQCHRPYDHEKKVNKIPGDSVHMGVIEMNGYLIRVVWYDEPFNNNQSISPTSTSC